MSIVVIGLGIVGSRVLKEIYTKTRGKEDVAGIDIDKKKVRKLRKFGAIDRLDKAYDTYIICVYTTEQVFNLLKTLDYSKKPLVSVESTIVPGSEKEMAEYVLKNNGFFVISPHRFRSCDPDSNIFELTRLIAGANEQSLRKGLDFYKKFMEEKKLIPTSIEYATLSKIVENAHRFVEIAIAEEIKILCDSKGYDFNELRRCANTKWNIDIKEAKDGIGGNCLPKDMGIFNELFPKNFLFKSAVNIDNLYKKVKNEETKS